MVGEAEALRAVDGVADRERLARGVPEFEPLRLGEAESDAGLWLGDAVAGDGSEEELPETLIDVEEVQVADIAADAEGESDADELLELEGEALAAVDGLVLESDGLALALSDADCEALALVLGDKLSDVDIV